MVITIVVYLTVVKGNVCLSRLNGAMSYSNGIATISVRGRAVDVASSFGMGCLLGIGFCASLGSVGGGEVGVGGVRINSAVATGRLNR